MKDSFSNFFSSISFKRRECSNTRFRFDTFENVENTVLFFSTVSKVQHLSSDDFSVTR